MASNKRIRTEDGTAATTTVRDLASSGGELCEICMAYCRDTAALWVHTRRAHSFRPYRECPMLRCGRRFSTLSLIVDHLTHHARAPNMLKVYTCELCGHLARSRAAFRRHVDRRHPDARAAMCAVCDLYMGDANTLLDHVRCEHAAVVASEPDGIGGPYRRPKRVARCDVCGKRFPDHDALERHVPMHGRVDRTHREYLPYPPVRKIR